MGTGKSYALVYEVLASCIQNPGCDGVLGAPTFPMLRDVTQPALFEVLAQEEIEYVYEKSKEVVTLPLTGSRILMRSLETLNRMRGLNLAWFGIDELTYCKEEAWTILEARLRAKNAKKLKGFAVWTPKGFDWVYSRFIGPKKLPGHGCILAQPGENKAVLRVDPRFYERLGESYDEAFYQQEALGLYLNVFSGRVYTSFDAQRHEAQLAFDPAHPLCWTIDFNIDPFASLLCQQVGKRVQVLEEITLRGSAITMEMAEVFFSRAAPYLAALRQHSGQANARLTVKLYGDPAGQAGSTKSSRSDYEQIRIAFRQQPDYRLEEHVARAAPTVKDRVAAVNGMLKNALGETRLHIDARCKELRADLEQVAWLQGASGVSIDKNKDKKRTHWSDALGYLLHQEFRVDGFVRARITD